MRILHGRVSAGHERVSAGHHKNWKHVMGHYRIGLWTCWSSKKHAFDNEGLTEVLFDLLTLFYGSKWPQTDQKRLKRAEMTINGLKIETLRFHYVKYKQERNWKKSKLQNLIFGYFLEISIIRQFTLYVLVVHDFSCFLWCTLRLNPECSRLCILYVHRILWSLCPRV